MKYTSLVVAMWGLLIAPCARAQAVRVTEPYRQWDAGGGIAVRPNPGDDQTAIPRAMWEAQFTRYWSPHLTTAVAAVSARQVAYDSTAVAGGDEWVRHTVSPAAVVATAGYQFFDNVFVHPYLTGGLRLAWVADTVEFLPNRPPYSEVLVSTTAARPQLRPLVGGGFKSYFDNGRVFMRSELQLLVDLHGNTTAVARIGAGIDF